MKKEASSSDFNKILSDIKSIKIQGAENVCRAGIKAYLMRPNKSSEKKILALRPTEPLLQNALKILRKSKNKEKTAKKFLKNLDYSHKKISENGSKLIKNNMNIYTHCHSSTVMDILKLAKSQKKKFTVYTTEVEPLLQGHRTAKDLASSKIPVVITPDLAAEHSLVKCDLFLFGADAFSKSEVANKLGTSTLVELSSLHKIPTYSCGVSLKFTNKIKIKKRSFKEVWNTKIKNIRVVNSPFDKTKLENLTGIISEMGILKRKEFVAGAKKNLKNLQQEF